MKHTPAERAVKQAEALSRATLGLTLSNFPAIFAGFTEKGIPDSEIRPRENVFTFNAWRALGRSVRKGEHGVKILTFIETAPSKRELDQAAGSDDAPKPANHRRPWTTTVFHISQTEART
jgi:hypothetical protein